MVPDTMNPMAWLRKHLDDEGGNDLIREMVKAFADQLMSAEADGRCGAAWGERSPERTNSRNGYRERAFDTRAGTISLAIPKLRTGSYFPDWLFEPGRWRARPRPSTMRPSRGGASSRVFQFLPQGRAPELAWAERPIGRLVDLLVDAREFDRSAFT